MAWRASRALAMTRDEDAGAAGGGGAWWRICTRRRRRRWSICSRRGRFERQGYLTIDPVSLRSLEVLRTIRGNCGEGSLVQALDRTHTPMGSRLLRNWLCYPLRDLERNLPAARGRSRLLVTREHLLTGPAAGAGGLLGHRADHGAHLLPAGESAGSGGAGAEPGCGGSGRRGIDAANAAARDAETRNSWKLEDGRGSGAFRRSLGGPACRRRGRLPALIREATAGRSAGASARRQGDPRWLSCGARPAAGACRGIRARFLPSIRRS